MRTTFLLALGHMIVHWGGSKLALQRRLALLGDVSQLSNPRFGAGRTIARTMEKTLAFFRASHCILLTRDTATGNWILRTLRKDDACEHVSVRDARPHRRIAADGAGSRAYRRQQSPALAPDRSVRAKPCASKLHAIGWRAEDPRNAPAQRRRGRHAGGRAFISAPLPLRLGEGRVFVSSRDGLFNKSDALFLAHLMEQIFPVIETIEVLDRMASEAASTERLKISLDLHDTAVQPYIGLRMGLCALRKKAARRQPAARGPGQARRHGRTA
jgi:signal transduction histidine kinase